MKKIKFFVALTLVIALSLTLLACREETLSFTPGTYTVSYGEAGVPGWRLAPLVLNVSFSESAITDIEVVSHGESDFGAGWWFRAFPFVRDVIMLRQSTLEVDAISGATRSKEAIINAVNMAIVKAGASPQELTPKPLPDAPLEGDLFVPGIHRIAVAANTMDIFGNPITADTPAEQIMLYSQDSSLFLTVSVGRNLFHVHEGGMYGLGGTRTEPNTHGESITPNEITDGTWGGWFFSQVTAKLINDKQATRGIDISQGATRTSAAIVWAVEQALVAAGGNPEALISRADNPLKFIRDPRPNAAVNFFTPGYFTVAVAGPNGEISLTLTTDRTLIRRISINSHSESQESINKVLSNLQEQIYTTQSVDGITPVAQHQELSSAIIDGVKQAFAQATAN